MRRRRSVSVRLKSDVMQRLLARKNIGYRQFARLVDLDSSYISKLLSGERSPSPATRKKLLAACPRLGEPEMGFDDLFVIEATGDGQER